MRKIAFAFAALLLGAAGLQAEEPASSYSITSDFTYTTRYYFRGVKNQENAFQPSVTFAQGPLSLGVWTSQALNKKFASWAEGSEIDLFGSYSVPINDKYSVPIGLTYYWYPSARASFGEPDYTWEPSIGITGPVGPLSGSLTYFHDFKLKSNTLQLNLGYSIPLPQDKGSFDIGGYYGSSKLDEPDTGILGAPSIDYQYYGLDVSLSYKLTAKATVKIGVHWTDTSGDLDAPSDNTWFTIGVTTGF
jgi:uncharacterized protein (TIGR02001 family)